MNPMCGTCLVVMKLRPRKTFSEKDDDDDDDDDDEGLDG
jgi:hypothetical protein